jgi:hypothetical protein
MIRVHETTGQAPEGSASAAPARQVPPALDRRGFVLAALSAPALAVASVGAEAVQAARAQPADADPALAETPPDGHYHETEHIRRYYALAAY